jgi:riboflavin kinase/FMN adenylyltransferase
MIMLTWADLLERRPPLDRKVQLSVGVFDGLHVGHRRLLSEITCCGADALSVVITFSRNPAVVHSPGSFPGAILTFKQKMERIDSLGVNAAVVIDFSEEMSNLSGEEFVRLLRENLTIQRIVVGKNFRFGKRRISGTDDLKEMLSKTGTEVFVTEPVHHGGSMVSSSRIRTAIRNAAFGEVQLMLDSPHVLDLRAVRKGFPNGSVLRIPRSEIDQVLPPTGEYAVRSESLTGTTSGICRVAEDSLTLAAENCSSATLVFFAGDE